VILVPSTARVALREFEPKFAAAGAVQAEVERIVGTRHAIFPDLEFHADPNQLAGQEISSRCSERDARDPLIAALPTNGRKGRRGAAEGSRREGRLGSRISRLAKSAGEADILNWLA
jgi:hypothetical protein